MKRIIGCGTNTKTSSRLRFFGGDPARSIIHTNAERTQISTVIDVLDGGRSGKADTTHCLPPSAF